MKLASFKATFTPAASVCTWFDFLSYRRSGSEFYHIDMSGGWKRWFRGKERPSRFRSAEEVCLYVDDQLAAALPPDWAYQRKESLLEWIVAPKVREPHSLEDDYILEVSGDYRLFILYFGNSSAGCDIVGQTMLTAVVLTSKALSTCSLGTALKRMIEHRDDFRLNMWTLT